MMVRLGLTLQQLLGMEISEPAPFLGDADGHHLKTSLINGVEYRRRRKQRHLMLTTATTKKNAYTKLFQSRSPFSVLRSPLKSIKQECADVREQKRKSAGGIQRCNTIF